MSRNPGEAFESECVAGLLSFRQHDTTCECRQLTVSSGEVRLDPRRRGGPDAPEGAARQPRGELNSPCVLICVGGLFPGDSAVEPVVSMVSHGCVDRIVVRSDCMFVCGTTSKVQVMSPLSGAGGFGSPGLT